MTYEPNSANHHDGGMGNMGNMGGGSLPPDLEAISVRLAADGAAWQRGLAGEVSLDRVAARIRAIPGQASRTSRTSQVPQAPQVPQDMPQRGETMPNYRSNDDETPSWQPNDAPAWQQGNSQNWQPDDTPTWQQSSAPRWQASTPPPPPPSRPPSRRGVLFGAVAAVVIVALLASVFVALANRGGTSVATDTTPTLAQETPTLTLTPTATTEPTATPNAANPLPADHVCADADLNNPDAIHLGDLSVRPVDYVLGYPATLLSGTTAGQPYKMPPNMTGESVNPGNGSPTVSLIICNTSATASHRIEGVSVSIVQVTPLSETANVWPSCTDATYYQRPNGVSGGGGCGGGLATDANMSATFATNATTGQTVTARDKGDGLVTMPVTMQPHQAMLIAVNLTLPKVDGRYTLGFALTYDGQQPQHIDDIGPTLFTAHTQEWTGQACTKPEMLAQIPESDTTNRYICPA